MRIKAIQIYIEVKNAFFQLLELFMPDNMELLVYDISCYYKNMVETVK